MLNCPLTVILRLETQVMQENVLVLQSSSITYILYCYVENVCQNLDSLFGCTTGTIHIISATFGRQDKDICSKDGSTSNTNCKTDASELITYNCHNRKFCIISGSIGKYGDPCRGTTKYLQIKYYCGPKGSHYTFLVE